MEAWAGTMQQIARKAHPRCESIRARGGRGIGGIVGSRALQEGCGQTQAHGSMTRPSVLGERQEAKPPKGRTASEQRMRDVRGDSPCRGCSKVRRRRWQASKLSVVEDSGHGVG